MQASESIDIVDELTAIDMKAAVSAGEIAEGLSKFANLGNLAGVERQQAEAYVATIADVTQMGGASAGQALKTIISRYGNVKAGAYSKLNLDADTMDDTKAVNDVERVLRNLGISIRSSNLEFRDFDEVLGEIAKKWTTLDTVSQKAIATSFAGIRQQEAFVTLMQNWDKYEQLLDVAQNAKGTAETKMMSYRESLQAASNTLASTVEEIINKAEISELLKNGIEILTKIAEVAPVIIKYLPNIFFTSQTMRALSGNSLFQKGWTAFEKSKLMGQVADFRAGNISGRQLAWRLGYGSIFGTESSDFRNKRGEFFHLEPSEKAKAKMAKRKARAEVAQAGQPGEEQPSSGIANDFKEMESITTKMVSNFEEMAKAAQEALTASKEQTAEEEKQTVADTEQTSKEYEQLTFDQLETAQEGEQLTFDTLETAQEQQQLAFKQLGTTQEYEQLTFEQLQTMQDREQAMLGQQQTGIKLGAPATHSSSGFAGMAVMAGVTAAVSSAMTSVTAYMSGGASHKRLNGQGEEVDTQSSEAAKAAGKNTIAKWAWIPMFGQMIGESLAESEMRQIDAQRDAAAALTERADSILGTLNNITGEITTLSGVLDSTSAEDATAREKAVRSITDLLYKQENSATKYGLEKYLGRSISSALSPIVSGTVADRKQALRDLQIAQAKLYTEQHRNSHAQDNYEFGHGSNADAWINYNKTREGYNADYGITNEAYENALAVGRREGAVLGNIGGAIQGAGVATMGIAGWSGIGAIIGAAVAGVGTAVEGLSFWLKNDKEKSELLGAQEKEKEEWSNKSFAEQLTVLTEEREKTIGAIDSLSGATENNTEALENANAKLEAINSLITADENALDYWRGRLKELQTDNIAEALLEAQTSGDQYLTDLTISQASNLKTSGLYETLAEQVETRKKTDKWFMYDIDPYIYRDKQGKVVSASEVRAMTPEKRNAQLQSGELTKELTAEFKKYAKSSLQTDEELRAAMAGENYTVAGALKNLDFNDWADREVLENFAQILGTTLSGLQQNQNFYTAQYGTLTYSELMKSTEELIEEQNGYNGLLQDITDSTKSATEWMNKITEQYPELIRYMSDTPTLLSKIMEKMHDMVQYEFTTQWKNLAQSEVVFDDPNSDKDLRGDILGYITKTEGASRADHINELINGIEGKPTFETLMKKLYGLDEDSADFKTLYGAILHAGESYQLTSDYYKEQLKNFTEYNAKILGMQIDNLTKQRDTLQEINKQREYENKLIEAKLKLESAMEDKRRIYREGVGFVYEADQKNIQEAKQELDDLSVEKQVSKLTKMIEILQGEKDEWDNMWDKRNFELQEKHALAFYEEFTGVKKWSSAFASLTREEAKENLEGYTKGGIMGAFGVEGSGTIGEVLGLTADLGEGSKGLAGNMASMLAWAKDNQDGLHSYFKEQTGEIIQAMLDQKAGAVKTMQEKTAAVMLAADKLGYGPDKLASMSASDMARDATLMSDPGFRQAIADAQDYYNWGVGQGYWSESSDGNAGTFGDFTTSFSGADTAWGSVWSKEMVTMQAGTANPEALAAMDNPYAGQTIYFFTKDHPMDGVWDDTAAKIAVPQTSVNAPVGDSFKEGQKSDIYLQVPLKANSLSRGKVDASTWNVIDDNWTIKNAPNGIYFNDKDDSWFMIWQEKYFPLSATLGKHDGAVMSSGDRQVTQDYLLNVEGAVIGKRSSSSSAYWLPKNGTEAANYVKNSKNYDWSLYDFNQPDTPWAIVDPTTSSKNNTGGTTKTPPKSYTGKGHYTKALGTTNLPTDGDALINELGTEAIITPSGTLTALPARTGIVPADITKNLWSLGEVAPSILRAVNNINPLSSSVPTVHSQSIDESFNISNLTMHVNADSSFDPDAFVRAIKSRVAITNNSHM